MLPCSHSSHVSRLLGKGLANHLQVPLPYLLYRAQVRYEEDLRGLQGIKGALSPTSPPAVQSAPSNTPPANPPNSGTSNEYFPTTPLKAFPRRDSLRLAGGPLSASGSGARPPIRVRLNSLGHRSLASPQKVSSSSILTLQGPKRPHGHLRPLTPTSSHASPSSDAEDEESSSEDDEARREAEEEKRAEQQEALERKLRELERRMTKEALGLVASPPKPAPYRAQDSNGNGKGKGREGEPARARPLSTSSGSSSLHQRLDMSRVHTMAGTRTPSHHSLSSASSPQGSIPSIPSPPPEPRSPRLVPTKPFSPTKSTSPPAVNHGPAWGTVRTVSRTRLGGNVRSDRGSEIGSGASSLSDFSGEHERLPLWAARVLMGSVSCRRGPLGVVDVEYVEHVEPLELSRATSVSLLR